MQPQNCNKYTACYAPHIIILYNIRYGYGYYTGIISPPSVSAFVSRRYTFARAIVAARLSRMPRILRHALLMICIVCHVAFSLRQQRTEAAIGRSRLVHSLVVFFLWYIKCYITFVSRLSSAIRQTPEWMCVRVWIWCVNVSVLTQIITMWMEWMCHNGHEWIEAESSSLNWHVWTCSRQDGFI